MTSECIDSVIEKTLGISYEIILVDNGSTDGSKEYFEKDTRIKYIYSKENLGFGRANNLGYKYSSGKYIFLLNSDTLLIENSIFILINFMRQHNCAIAGCQLINKYYLNIHSFSLLFPSITWEINILLKSSITKLMEQFKERDLKKNGFMEVAYITGADMMLKRESIEKHGLFNPKFFMYFEETELSFRYKKNGESILFVPKTKIIHLENASFKTTSAKEKLFLDGRHKYYSLTQSTLKFKIANWVYALTCIVGMIINIKNKNKRNYFKTKLTTLKSNLWNKSPQIHTPT